MAAVVALDRVATSGAENETADDIVGDGSLDVRGAPANRHKTGLWRASSFVYASIFGDTVVVISLGGNLVPYLFGTLHLSIAQSANTVSNFMGTVYLLPLFWGFLADAYFGRFRTIAGTSIITVAGVVLLTVSAAVPALQPAACTPTLEHPICPRASQYVLNWFYAAIFLIAIGSAGSKPCVTSLGQDQFDETDPDEQKKGLHFFTGFYIMLNVGTLFNVTALYYLQQEAGFKWGYGAMAGIYIVCLSIFFLGTPFYRYTKPFGSPLTRLAQVVVAAFKNRNKQLPKHASELYERVEMGANNKIIMKLFHTKKLTFLDRAAIPPTDNTKEPSKWVVCTVTQVEELKTVIQILPIWLTTVSVYIMFSQMISFSVQQASSLDRHIGSNFRIPPGSMGTFLVLGALSFLPIYEKLLVPLFRKVTGHPQGLPPLRRIGIALLIGILGLVIAAEVEKRRVNVIRDHKVPLLDIVQGRIPMGFYWLIPQFAILGVVEFLIGVAQLNFFYREAPDSMKSVAASLYFTTISVGYYLSTALVKAVNRYTNSSGGWLYLQFNSGGLANYYYLLAVILSINLVIYLGCAHWYTHKKVDEKTHPSDEKDAVI